MTKWFKQRPVAMFILFLVIIGLLSTFGEDESDYFYTFLLGIVGLMGFVNSMWLNQRINRLQDALEEKGLVNGIDFIVDDKLRDLINKNK